MTTTAWATPGFELNPLSDVMDIHSDRGVDVDNVDVDIDFDPSRSPATYGDDLSLKDAVLEGEPGPQTASADQDDFMVDNEDLIEEDTIAYEEDAVIVDEPSANQNEVDHSVDDDLIDYSDDEEDSTPKEDGISKNTDLTSARNDTAASVAESGPTEIGPTSTEIEHTAVDPADEYDESKIDELETTGEPGENWQEAQEAAHQQELSIYADVDSNDAQPEENEYDHEDQGAQKQDNSEDVEYVAHASNDIHSPSGQEIELHPVTINYSGAELWLFKHHDYEDSGDYLVEDTSITNKPISSVLEACRSALGEDVTDDIELGFRLDNFRNIELYQDHSSCAFITLEHIVGLYLQLHAQDGISDPESFYMTLLSRPRVSALFNALNEAASEGIGHVGLEKAIAAGLTSFNARLSHNTAVNSYDWGNEEEHQGHVADVANGNQVEGNGNGEHETHNEHEEEEQYENSAQTHEGGAQESELVEEIIEPTTQDQNSFATDGALSEPENVTLNVADNDDIQPAPATGSPRTEEQAGDNDVQKSPSQQEDDDFVDYSDDEDEGEPQPEDLARQPSSLSSTVQGDDTFPVQEIDQETEGLAVAEHDPEQSNDYHVVVDEEDYAQYADADGGFDAEAYEQYDEQYDELQAPEHTENDDAQEAFQSQSYEDLDTNNYNVGSEEQATGHYDGKTAGVDGNYEAQVTVAGGGSIVGDDELENFDLADATADVTSYDAVGDNAFNDQYSHNDENDGDGQAQVAAVSADVEPVAALSSESLNLSPQGQKRTIDEVGNDVGEATDPSDAKRPRV
ncbi:hypothetical protein DM02DRAFT_611145 [Periconia macrospinosa]|uniref:Uncharacterized protein n=1 Tax=Periconia macrospinosa TaxID=97972 RepID=A0A2V1E607_9PLEO|nr:hypothetical protein DM02DRAFT_611145 [Periconia macrospinosa]